VAGWLASLACRVIGHRWITRHTTMNPPTNSESASAAAESTMGLPNTRDSANQLGIAYPRDCGDVDTVHGRGREHVFTAWLPGAIRSCRANVGYVEKPDIADSATFVPADNQRPATRRERRNHTELACAVPGPPCRASAHRCSDVGVGRQRRQGRPVPQSRSGSMPRPGRGSSNDTSGPHISRTAPAIH
jgi:hypothetical protein